MRDYELTLVLKPALTDQVREKLLEKIKKLVEDTKGKIESQDLWGKKLLAYSIKKENEGVFAYFVLFLPEKEVANIEKKIGIEEDILRYLLVRKD